MPSPEDIHRQLDIPRERAAALGHEALAIVNAGEYVTRSGRRASIATLVSARGALSALEHEALFARLCSTGPSPSARFAGAK